MAKLEAPKRIRAEDYDKDDRNLVNRLGGTINDFQDSVYQILNGRIDFENLARRVVNVEVQTDATGKLLNTVQVKTNLNSKVIGINCIDATNLTSPSTFPLSHPFVSFTITTVGTITIINVTGLQNNSRYSLRLELIT